MNTTTSNEQCFTKNDTSIVKGMAIISLFFYHLFGTYDKNVSLGVISAPVPLKLLSDVSAFGNICVAVFALLSAYGITKSLLNSGENDIKADYRYCIRRYLKLLAGFLCVYISVNLIFINKIDLASVYGTGMQGLICGLLDAFEMAEICQTPTLCLTWWYMEIAIVTIFSVPLILRAVKKMGNFIIIPGLMLTLIVEMPYDIYRYYFVILLGVVAAHENWFEFVDNIKIHKAIKMIIGIALLPLVIKVRQNYMVYHNFTFIIDAPIAFYFSWLTRECFGRFPVIKQILSFVGKHSMNIFLTHTFVYMMFYEEFIYSFKYAGLIFLVLLAICLAYSVCLELIKTGAVKLFMHIFHQKASEGGIVNG